jgi:SAM-dependent methyltransferase
MTETSSGQPPLPPSELASWAGGEHGDLLGSFDRIGRGARERILWLLPEAWSFEGKRVLDFGCGSGKVLRHFLAEAESCEFQACDLHEPSIRWVREHLSPPVDAFVSPDRPPLPRPDGHFDLIWAISVFTHIADGWSSWLLELHRMLTDEGLLIASFLGEGMHERFVGEPFEERQVGMNVMNYGQPWEEGSPNVLHSRWWVEAHWGRAFDVIKWTAEAEGRQSYALFRKRPAELSSEDLERVASGEPRELEAQHYYLRQLQDQIRALRADRAALRAESLALRSERDELSAKMRIVSRSRSWRITRPLRRLGRALARRE